MHHRLGIDEGDRLLDVACGSGLSLELAHLRGAVCSGVGEAAFAEAATNEAIAHIRDGLPLRAEIALVGYLARAPRVR